MKSSLVKGVSLIREVIVDTPRTIEFMGEECRVYATPSLVHDVEHACRDLIMEHADPGEDSVGSMISVTHTAPTLRDMKVRIIATVSEVDHRKVVFEISASDPVDQISTGRHERFGVDVERTRQRLESKAARIAAKAT